MSSTTSRIAEDRGAVVSPQQRHLCLKAEKKVLISTDIVAKLAVATLAAALNRRADVQKIYLYFWSLLLARCRQKRRECAGFAMLAFRIFAVALVGAAFIVSGRADDAATVKVLVHFPEAHLAPGYLIGVANDAIAPASGTASALWGITEPGNQFSLKDRVSNNTWQVDVTVPGPFPRFLRLEFAALAGVKTCDFYAFPCVSQGPAATVLVPAAGTTVVAHAFPHFGGGAGNVTTMFPSLYSPQLSNSRPIAVYTPRSLLENTIPRPVRVILITDGLPEVLADAASYAFDPLMRSGVIPEAIVIGVAPVLANRIYENTFSPCDPTIMDCSQGYINAGGADKYLDFLKNTVIPAVVANIPGLSSVSEVTLVGWSQGGFSSCYGTISRPMDFQRALCGSPSVWWNAGQIVPAVIQPAWKNGSAAAAANGGIIPAGFVPKSIVMHLGTAEMFADNNAVLPSYSNATWFDYFNKTYSALSKVMATPGLSAGLSAQMPMLLPAPQTPTSMALSANLSYPGIVSAYINTGGFHTFPSWFRVLGPLLTVLFADAVVATGGAPDLVPIVSPAAVPQPSPAAAKTPCEGIDCIPEALSNGYIAAAALASGICCSLVAGFVGFQIARRARTVIKAVTSKRWSKNPIGSASSALHSSAPSRASSASVVATPGVMSAEAELSQLPSIEEQEYRVTTMSDAGPDDLVQNW
jgi:enterochelin esterase-like enzyme